MTVENVPDDGQSPFLAVPIAISFVEECLMEDTPGGGTHLPGKNPWERMVALATERRGSLASPADVAKLIKAALAEQLDEPGGLDVVPVAMAQCDHPQFVLYIAGKMGAM